MDVAETVGREAGSSQGFPFRGVEGDGGFLVVETVRVDFGLVGVGLGGHFWSVVFLVGGLNGSKRRRRR